MCCSEVAEKARKCPHCHHFQNRTVMILYHPAFAATMVLVPFLTAFFLMLLSFEKLFDQGRDFQVYRNQVTITESNLAFGDTKSGETVAVLGMMKNSGPVGWKDVLLQVEFFNQQGKRIDTEQRREFPFDIPPNETVPFKVSVRREFSKESYAKHAIRIISAKDSRARW